MLSLPALQQEVYQEFLRIFQYWETHTVDPRGGFYGRIDADNQPDLQADKAIVLNARILWAFSLAYRVTRKPDYRTLADRAYQFIKTYFWDKKNGGVYWSVKADGSPSVTKKQLYGQGFALYGLSEYYRATKIPQVLDDAKQLFRTLVEKAYDPKQGGFIEAFNEDWSQTEDYILSKGEERKSMNTHLHLIEPFTNLYRVWPDPELKKHVRSMLENDFMGHIINPESYHMRLFFTEDWQVKSTEISFGHDVEASWLLYETAEVLNEKGLLAKVKELSLKMVTATLEGLNPDGALTYEFDPTSGHKNEDRSWWVLSEQMVGYFNAYQLSGKQHFLEKSQQSWAFIKEHLIDYNDGEWFEKTDAHHQPSRKADKVNAWKCPYHNSRACYEIWHRMQVKK
ncbi:AGE family epimerase/isomerase [Siphonobacter sp. SORGH_AS_0500]|uniref:AGE family epimerase/isomerase n=1 Tax=Siphonobacter sp. SORGH_AS_0500 TaxID=1864824 RepID=UPI00285889B3|nr:AGE family epimerase/isomerase [Siphonobacter sp. SORGH_AS_0500]MDR6195551.1 mannobiose 2-epimerase [Siphonobacter sp. SORGH_AS_0500]